MLKKLKKSIGNILQRRKDRCVCISLKLGCAMSIDFSSWISELYLQFIRLYSICICWAAFYIFLTADQYWSKL